MTLMLWPFSLQQHSPSLVSVAVRFDIDELPVLAVPPTLSNPASFSRVCSEATILGSDPRLCPGATSAGNPSAPTAICWRTSAAEVVAMTAAGLGDLRDRVISGMVVLSLRTTEQREEPREDTDSPLELYS